MKHKKVDFYSKPTPSQDKNSAVKASIVGSIKNLEARNREESKLESASSAIGNMLHDLSDVKADSLSDMTDEERDDAEYDYKRATMNNT